MKINERTVTVNGTESNMNTISAAEIYHEFLKLNDAQKDKIINSLVAEGVDNDSLEALRFLAVLSNEGFRDRVLSSLYATEAYNKLISEKA